MGWQQPRGVLTQVFGSYVPLLPLPLEGDNSVEQERPIAQGDRVKGTSARNGTVDMIWDDLKQTRIQLVCIQLTLPAPSEGLAVICPSLSRSNPKTVTRQRLSPYGLGLFLRMLTRGFVKQRKDLLRRVKLILGVSYLFVKPKYRKLSINYSHALWWDKV